MPFRRIPDPRLYTDRAYCLAAGFDLPHVPSPGSLIVHCYLFGPLTQHHALCVRSILATQRPPFEVWIWLDPDGPGAGAFVDLVGEYSDRFAPGGAALLKVLDWRDLASHTAIEGHPLPAAPVCRSNLLRHLAQAKHGGIYVDLDTVVLRDLRGLLGAGVVYQWCAHPWGNSAICAFSPRDSYRLLEECRRRIDAGELDPFHPRTLFAFARELPGVDVLVLPVFLFDPLWPAAERREVRLEAFLDTPSAVPLELSTFWPGAYCYHWHNGWQIPIAPGSPADLLWESLERLP